MPRKILEEKLRNMLAEDIGEGDITTALIVPPGATGEAEVRFKEPGVAAGIEESTVLLESLGLKTQALFRDGDEVEANKVIIKISGDARTILSVERTLLNLLSRMSGIATATRQLVKKILNAKLKTRVACTRKTAPGLLYFDKKAVLLGGGDTHRLHLDDMILIKDNHIAMVGSLQDAVRSCKERGSFSKKIEVEVTSPVAAVKAAEAGADIIMLDNFPLEQVEEAIGVLEKAGFLGKVLVEASGGITAENVLAFASRKVDIVSLGEITESPRALDINLRMARQKSSRLV
ncbi:MAG TPA: carboxylating nicotinate-nucleotide diphosphorylase [candidate division Zixibacteria bacterium]|nr:carboxylating nicotinate-nucleotide diphosphorylase [candidate division Zixibacteria bacterium]